MNTRVAFLPISLAATALQPLFGTQGLQPHQVKISSLGNLASP